MTQEASGRDPGGQAGSTHPLPWLTKVLYGAGDLGFAMTGSMATAGTTWKNKIGT